MVGLLGVVPGVVLGVGRPGAVGYVLGIGLEGAVEGTGADGAGLGVVLGNGLLGAVCGCFLGKVGTGAPVGLTSTAWLVLGFVGVGVGVATGDCAFIDTTPNPKKIAIENIFFILVFL